jgi:hypothetical protein
VRSVLPAESRTRVQTGIDGDRHRDPGEPDTAAGGVSVDPRGTKTARPSESRGRARTILERRASLLTHRRGAFQVRT